MFKTFAAMMLATGVGWQAVAAQTCAGGSVNGVVRDSTAALMPGTTVTLDGKAERKSGADGGFSFACVTAGKHTVAATYEGFLPAEVQVTVPRGGDLTFRLVPSSTSTVTVDAGEEEQVQAPGGGNGVVISGKQLQALADDPDDLLREIQQLSAQSGGSPSRATIAVDGFQDDAKVPPKESIARINVSPDLYSAEYRDPPYGGGRVEIYTKPGAKAYHGSLFGTNSSSFMNARDPFTTTTGTIGKQRYGFDFTGPVTKQGSNFRLDLEHRSIDETVAVNAVTSLDASGNPVNTLDTVPIPQRLWNGDARVDAQLGPKNIAFVSYSANVNHLENLGVGGQTLREAGYDSGQNDQTVRASDVTTISPRLVHETRASFERYIATSVPTSTLPSLQVEGYFTGGGSVLGNLRDRRYRTEFGDDFILNTKSHLIKAGVQLQYVHRNSDVPTGFNGAYVFSGYGLGTAASPSVSGLQQFQQAQAQAGVTATEFNGVAGNPNVQVSQVRFAAFYQDNVTLSPKWKMFYGLRYAFETDPFNFNSIAPRVGFSYVPDKKQTWVIKTHFGIFNGQYSGDEAQELHREDGVERVTSLVYSAVYGSPFSGATVIHAERTIDPHLNAPTFASGEFNVSKELPYGFNVTVETVLTRILNDAYTTNINQPLGPNPTPSAYGPRPLAPNLDILETRSNGTGQGRSDFIGLSNFRRKRVQFFVGGLHLNVRSNGDNTTFFQPQSAYSLAGEIVRPTGQALWQTFGNVTIALPYKVTLSGNGYGSGGMPFNLLTGSDNNGDGNFNDRPQYAPAGAVANGTTVFQTRYGLLTNAGAIVNGVPVAPIARNLGALPWTFHLDANLSRTFPLTENAKAVHRQTLAVNVRSANFLNHTNVTAEGSVIGTPQFLVPVAADTARRVEFGLRYNF